MPTNPALRDHRAFTLEGGCRHSAIQLWSLKTELNWVSFPALDSGRFEPALTITALAGNTFP